MRQTYALDFAKTTIMGTRSFDNDSGGPGD